MAKKKRHEIPFDKHIERQQELYHALCEKYGLDKPLRHPGIGYDFAEIERQIDVLLNISREPGGGVDGSELRRFVSYCASLFLGCYMAGKTPPSPKLVLLIGQQLKVADFSYSKAKKPISLLKAQEFVGKHPDALQIDVAREVGVSRGTVSKWVKAGKLHLGWS